MQTSFLSPDSPRLGEVLSQVGHDFFHLPDYLRLTAQYEGGEPVVFLADENGSVFLVPLIVRPIAGPADRAAAPLYDATSPYSYASPLFHLKSPGQNDE